MTTLVGLGAAGEAFTLRTDTSKALVPLEEIIAGGQGAASRSTPRSDPSRRCVLVRLGGFQPGHLRVRGSMKPWRFHLREQAGPPPLVRFVNLVFQTFNADITRLQDEKIAVLAAHRGAHPDRDIFEDRSLEILSRVEIDVRARAGGVGSAVIPVAR
jgi:hypothetical protein